MALGFFLFYSHFIFFMYQLFSVYIIALCPHSFILAVPMSKCWGQDSCMSFTFFKAIMNGLNSHMENSDKFCDQSWSAVELNFKLHLH